MIIYPHTAWQQHSKLIKRQSSGGGPKEFFEIGHHGAGN